MSKLSRWLLRSGTGYQPLERRSAHTYAVGQSGTGKTRALESWIMQDIVSDRALGGIDPHGDLYQRLLIRLASMPEHWNRVVVIDPCNPKWTVCLNPLAAFDGLSQERLALFITDIVINIWKIDPPSAPRMIWLLTNSLLALAFLGLTLLELRQFLVDRSFRESLLPRLDHDEVRAYFMHEYPKTERGVNEWAAPVLNKLGKLIFDPDLRLMFAPGVPMNFRRALDEGLILLVNLSKGVFGEEPSSLLGAFIVALIQKAALSRTDTLERPPFYLYLDEFQNYTTDNIQDILAESRKFGLSLIMSNQYIGQLSPELRSAVLNTARTLVCFRVGFQDAKRLAGEIFPSPDFLTSRRSTINIGRLGRMPLVQIGESQNPLGWDGLAQELAQLPQREFWLRQRGAGGPTKQRTLNMPDPKVTLEVQMNLQRLLDRSGERYGRLKKDVERELAARRGSSGDSAAKQEVPFWSN